MGQAMNANGLPPELPVMAALVESGLTNRRPGRDGSAGYFRLKTSIWNAGEYTGYPDHPELQLLWFVRYAEQVRRFRLARGAPDPKQSASRYGEWAADVIRPAASQRGRYQRRLAQARQLLAPMAAPAAPGTGAPAAAPAVPTP